MSKLRAPVAFYFDVGKYEPQFIPAHHQLVPLLEAKGCPCVFQELVGGHNWTNWRAHLKDLLTFLWRESVPLADEKPPARDAAAAKKKTVKPAPVGRAAIAAVESVAVPHADTVRQQGWSPYVERELEDGQLRYTLALPECRPQDIGLLVVSNQLVVQLTLANTENGGTRAGTF